MDLNELRLEIDKIDDELVQLFVKRMAVSADIADYKKTHALPIFVPSREAEKLLDVAEKAGPELETYTKVLYSMLFELSRGYQSQRNAARTPLYASIQNAMENTPKMLPKDATVAYLGGDEGVDLVCRKLVGDCPLLTFKSIDGILSAVSQGLCRYGIVPMDGSASGLYDRLQAQKLYIVRAFRLQNMRYLCVSAELEIFPGADKTSIRMALSDRPGALYKVLSRLYTLGINVARVESRPITEKSFQAMFYFDLETSVYSDEFVQLICELQDLCEAFSYLGSYCEVV